ncbi:uncharacterized protein LOC126900701 isoform X2 [Daktulosphaira vitifoliae]|uniref:uncharacterized protein LOC126900701 isoform X1 n=1 Tax=Daktulosphaira vitifoliae TaxID=58002 RepID=UPI0021AA6460|nr:uncharacterized protein LOC126900701 isoform X1 [Daktulosphaira vitifoliae]XP_050532569.1 uncharacterized protein LOC126900701 isoform X2 [Daktulosphaira vitifoliae]
MWLKIFRFFCVLLLIILPKVLSSSSQNENEENSNNESINCLDIINKINIFASKEPASKVVYIQNCTKMIDNTCCFETKQLKFHHYFHPFDNSSFINKANELKLTFKKPKAPVNLKPKILKKAVQTEHNLLNNDTNSMFVLLSVLLTNSEKNYIAIRNYIYEEIARNEKIKNVLKAITPENYLKVRDTRDKGIFGTQLELLAASHVFDVCIYLYMHGEINHYWVLFDKELPNIDNMENKKCLYIAQTFTKYYYYHIKDVLS